ncbi:hypothetical protein [Taklimakanibacter deserti]|uniref:hypothetical protein n=1 Tax=Taklimakanibacter deserti TaxID=2267839 RepID=UPI000E657E46
MNRVTLSAGRHVAVAIVFLCVLALSLCQILGPTARLNHDFRPADLSEPGLVTLAVQTGAAHSPLPSRCASIKLAPIEIATADFAPAEAACGTFSALTSAPPQSAELSVPTPPPRRA